MLQGHALNSNTMFVNESTARRGGRKTCPVFSSFISAVLTVLLPVVLCVHLDYRYRQDKMICRKVRT